MTDHDRNLIRRIFLEVVELPPLQRAAALDRLCAGNASLRAQVERLLTADADAAGFMARPTGAGMDIIQSELPTASIAPITEKPGEIIGPYKLLQVIGEGGFGTVFMAEQQKPVVRKVALKIIKLGMDTRQVVARFEQERQALALMDHPNIAKVFDGGATDSGRPYFVMELVRGVPITEYADANNLSAKERLELFIPVCHAVQHAHHKGVIHRDIKPSNILVTLHDGKPVPKVIDFGVAKATQSRLTEKTLFTEHKQFIGTPAYMAPEQAELSGLDIDTRADVYALGVLLYELLTGTTPFDARSLLEAGYAEMQRIIREVEPPKPSTRVATLAAEAATTTAAKRRIEPARFAPLLRGDLDWMVMKALEKDRTRRYDTPVDFLQDVQRHLAGEPVVAAPPSAAYRIRKFVRRNKARVIAASVVMSVLVLGIIGTSAGFAEASRNAKQAAKLAQSERLAKIEAQEKRTLAERKTAEAEAERIKVIKAGETIEYNSYVANIQAAKAALDLRQFDRLRARLDACPERLRGWEWGWLNAESDSSLLTLRGHGAALHAASFSLDGTRVVTACDGFDARVWDVQSGACLLTVSEMSDALGTKIGTLTTASFDPSGTRIITASVGGVARVWDARTGSLLALLKEHTGPVWSARFSPDGTRVVTASDDKTARVWDSTTGATLAVLKGHTNAVSSANFSPDGTRIVTAANEVTARVWDAASGAPLAELKGHKDWMRSASFSPDGTRIVTASHDNTARVWDATSGAPLAELKGHTGWWMSSASFSPDGTRIFTASNDGTARVWDATSGAPLAELKGHTGWVSSVSFSPDGTRIATASGDGTARVWDAATGAPLAELKGHSSWVSSVSFSPDGTRIATASGDKTARVWDANMPKPDIGGMEEVSQVLLDVEVSHDSLLAVTKSDNYSMIVWDIRNGLAVAELKGHNDYVFSASFSSDGALIVSASADGTARVWDAVTGVCLTVLRGHSRGLTDARFNDDACRVVTASFDCSACIWDTATGAIIAKIERGTSPVLFASYSFDGTRIITRSLDGTQWVWDATDGRPLDSPTSEELYDDLASHSPDGSLWVTTEPGGYGFTYGLRGPVRNERGRDGYLMTSAKAAFGGRRIYTEDTSGLACIWDPETLEQIVSMQGGYDDNPRLPFLSHDGVLIVTSSAEGRLLIFDSLPYRERFPAIQRAREARARLDPIITQRLRGGAGIAELREAYAADTSLTPEDRTAAMAILFQKQQDAQQPQQAPQPAHTPPSSEP